MLPKTSMRVERKETRSGKLLVFFDHHLRKEKSMQEATSAKSVENWKSPGITLKPVSEKETERREPVFTAIKLSKKIFKA